MAKRIAILGSTGSIGRNTLEVIEALGPDFEVVALAAGTRWELLAEQARRYRPRAVGIADERFADRLRRALDGSVTVLAGPQALEALATREDVDFVVAAVVGSAGLPGTLAAVRAGKAVGLANKEALVVAGALLMPLARRTGAQLLPIDSEHSAIFQAMQAGYRSEVRKVYLTASGGPFRTWSAERIAQATLEDALKHPTWNMGPKITIDSATLMNKALEIIEAHWLFDLRADQIEVLVHPESVVHSLVEFCDGSIVAQLGTPDMRTPIQYALTYPHRREACGSRLDLASLGVMHFEPPDPERFPALRLGYEAARQGGTAGAVLSAANEAAVQAFRDRRIGFTDIIRLVEQTLRRHRLVENPSLEDLLAADHWARVEVARCVDGAAEADGPSAGQASTTLPGA